MRIPSHQSYEDGSGGSGHRYVLQPTDDLPERQAERIARQVARPYAPAARAGRQQVSDPGILRIRIGPRLADNRIGEDVARQIMAARGSGYPLQDDVRVSMEDAFGADFAGVRVHRDNRADGLNRSLNARAFTTGNDIFFRRGQYSPQSVTGRNLLAHELAHTVQQESIPGSQNLVQRAVGFEFETNYEVEQRRTKLFDLHTSFRQMRKGELIAREDGFRLEADENRYDTSMIEFIIDPPVSESNRARLETILSRLHAVAESLERAAGKQDQAVNLKFHSDDSNPIDYRITPRGTGELVANPQMTAGIRYDQILTLMSEIGEGSKTVSKTHQEAAWELERSSPMMPREAAARAMQIEGSPQFRALIALLGSYIRFGRKAMGRPPLDIAKLVSNSILLRTDFGSMFMKLPPEERLIYMSFPDVFASRVMEAAGLDDFPHDVPVLERGVRKRQNPNSAEHNELLENAATTLTPTEWLTEITKGTDLLSSHHNSDLKTMLMGLGALGPMTDAVGAPPLSPIGPNDKGAGIVMEFRNMKKHVPWHQWQELALKIFDYIVDLNARPQ